MKNVKLPKFIEEESHILFNDLYSQVMIMLECVPGHKIYHLEGRQDIHTNKVIDIMALLSRKTSYYYTYSLIGLLHDLGKAYTSKIDNEGYATYPNHASFGAKILHLFVGKNNVLYDFLYWIIENHIKMLFLWNDPNIPAKDKFNDIIATCPDNFKKFGAKAIIDLAIADIHASESIDSVKESQNKLLINLINLL